MVYWLESLLHTHAYKHTGSINNRQILSNMDMVVISQIEKNSHIPHMGWKQFVNLFHCSRKWIAGSLTYQCSILLQQRWKLFDYIFNYTTAIINFKTSEVFKNIFLYPIFQSRHNTLMWLNWFHVSLIVPSLFDKIYIDFSEWLHKSFTLRFYSLLMHISSGFITWPQCNKLLDKSVKTL